MKPFYRIWILVVLMVPLLLVRVNAYHDWGDDFAQYLLQAQWLGGVIEALPVSDTFFHGPQVKGVLFSLMLVPFVYFPVPLILLGKILVTLGLGLMGVLVFYRLRTMFPLSTALTITLLFLWHPVMLKLKDQVLPDFIFGAVVLAAMVLWDRNRRGDRHMALLLASFSFGLKSAGLALIAAMAILLIFQRPMIHSKLRSWVALLLPAMIMAVFEIILTGQHPSACWYSSASIRESGSIPLMDHAETYRLALLLLLETEAPTAVNQVIPWLVVPAMLLGFVMTLWQRKGIALLFLPLYLIMLLLYPYNGDPVRFLVPVLPWLLIYTGVFYSKIFSAFHLFRIRFLLPVMTLIMAIPFFNTTRLELSRTVVYDPWSFESRDMLKFLSDEVPKNVVVADIHPWSLSWFAGVHTVHSTAAYKADLMLIRSSNIEFQRFAGESGADLLYSNPRYIVLELYNK